MLKNDISNRLRLRFKKSTDFNKTIEQLREEGYVVKNRKKRKSKYKEITIYRNEILAKDKLLWDIKIVYEDNTDTESPYKQSIYYMWY